jgi:hypothetical protein
VLLFALTLSANAQSRVDKQPENNATRRNLAPRLAEKLKKDTLSI